MKSANAKQENTVGNNQIDTVDLVAQGKGGVGKSVLAALTAQYYQHKGKEFIAIDTDPVNSTFLGYKAFPVKRVELMKDDNKINTREFDPMMVDILSIQKSFVIDNGSSSFIPLANYLVENAAIEMIIESGKQVNIHTVITGGQAMLDTLSGLNSLCQQMPKEARIIVWLNEFWGPIESDGKTFEQMKVYLNNKDRISGIITLHKQSSDTFGKDMELMLEKRLTFAEAINSENFNIMQKQRLKMMQRNIFEQLDTVLMGA